VLQLSQALTQNPLVGHILYSLQRKHCMVDPFKVFKCKSCDTDKAAAYWSKDEGIVICENNLAKIALADQNLFEETLAHELIHTYDECTTNLNWDSCEQHACSEIRANNLSGECRFKNEFMKKKVNFFSMKGHHANCVKRRALISVELNPACSQEKAKRAIDTVWDVCSVDFDPFDNIPY